MEWRTRGRAPLLAGEGEHTHRHCCNSYAPAVLMIEKYA